MKRSRIWLFILALVALLALSGCISIKEELWFNADGSGKMTVDIGMSKALLDMSQSSGSTSSDPFAEFKKQFENQSDPLVKNITPSQYTDKDVTHYAVTFEVTDMLKYIAQNAQSSSGTLDMTLKKLDNGNISFTQNLSSGELSSGTDLSSLGGDASQLDSMFKDMYWTMIIHSTSVVSADKTAKVDGGTVQWQIPMSQVFSQKTPLVLNAEFNIKGGSAGGGIAGSPLVIILIVVVVLLVIAAAVFFLLIRRKAPAAAAANPYGTYPPAQGYPQQQGFPPQQGYPPSTSQQAGYPAQQQGFPPQQSYAPQQGYSTQSTQQPGNPAKQGFPPQQGYAPQQNYPVQPGFPPPPPAAPATKTCANCGASAPAAAAFCPNCGHSLQAPGGNPPQ